MGGGFATPDGNLSYLMGRAAEEEPFRVLSMARAGQDVTPAMYGLELASGHHPNDLARYRELIGMVGEVTNSIAPDGKVFIHGEYWMASADVEIPAGARVVVLDVDGLRLRVRPASPGA